MKVIAYTALHYGAEYLAYAARSVINHVDEWHVLYSKEGSHGHRTSLPCPDTREQLLAIAMQAGGSKLKWWDGSWTSEGLQRMTVHEVAPDADVILVLDSDEVYADGLAQEAIEFAINTPARGVRLPFVHLWRSFKRGFTHDPSYPFRVINTAFVSGDVTMPTDKRIWHFGYCQSSEIVRYKVQTHGHKAEFRKDCNWFEDIFMTNRQYDCHPCGSEYWNVAPINLSNLPSVLQNHPNRYLEIVP